MASTDGSNVIPSMFGHPFRADSPASFVGPRPSHTTRIQPAWVRPARSQPSNPRDPTAPNSSPNATHLSWYSTPIHSHPHQPQPSASTANPSHRQPHSHHDPPAAQHRAAPAFVPDTQPTFEETTTISFTWTIRDLHLLREEVEHSPPPSEGGRSVSAGAGKSDIWTNPPVFGDGKWKLELVRTTRSLASPSHESPHTPHHTRPSASVDSTDATSSPTTASASITILSVYLTALVLDYTHANVEIPACIMLGLRPVRAPVGRRGAEDGGWLWRRFYDYTFHKDADLFTCHHLPSVSQMLQDDPVARQDAIALTIQLGLGPGHVRELEGLLGHGAVARVPVEVEGHHLVPRAMLTSLHGLLDDANTGDVRIIVRERGVRLPQPDKDAATSDDEETSSARSARIVPFPIGSAHPAQAQGEAEGEEQMYVRDRVLWAHASVLRSRSDYFGTMLGSEFSEGIDHVYGSGARRVRTLRIPDADFATAYWFLRYLYTDEVEFAPNEDVRSAVLDDEWAKPGQHAEGAQGVGEEDVLADWTPVSQLDQEVFGIEVGHGREVSGSFVHSVGTSGSVRRRTHSQATSPVDEGEGWDVHPHPSCAPGAASALAVFRLAHRYELHSLSRLAAVHLVDTLTPHSAFPTLLATSMYAELHARIKAYVYTHWHHVAATHEFQTCCDEVCTGVWGARAGKTISAFVASLVSPLVQRV